MSYDLLVFDPAIAPRDREEFMQWYKTLTRWDQPRDYTSPDGMTGNLPLFYDRLRADFPPMNGPHAFDFAAADTAAQPRKPSLIQKLFGKPAPAPEPFNQAFVTDYSLAENAIYMGFAWSIADQARTSVINTALSTEVGFFDVSSNNGVILHDPAQFYDLMGL